MYLCVHVYPFVQSVYRLVPLSPTIAPGKSCKTNRIIITHWTDAWHLFGLLLILFGLFFPHVLLSKWQFALFLSGQYSSDECLVQQAGFSWAAWHHVSKKKPFSGKKSYIQACIPPIPHPFSWLLFFVSFFVFLIFVCLFLFCVILVE